jgi:hypothetical protein
MTDDEFDLDAYIADMEAYAAVRDENVAFLGSASVSFYVAIAPSEVIRPIYQRMQSAGDTAVRAEYSRVIEDALNSAASGSPISVKAEPWGGAKTGGPIPDQTYVVQLLGWALAGMATIVVLVDFADVLHRIIRRAKELSENDVAISDGAAVILGAEAIFEKTGNRDLALAFVTPLNDYLPRLGEMDSPDDGWLVGFRSPDSVYVAHVDRYGEASVADTAIPVLWEPR